ncbi:cilia- and flagella-associated protein 61 isoform X1 [Denticeps clupeoides]|nr:cilia- and flagella-associated protein 61 isoform X1 [Denticeps clupeoides]XP_028809389.1 cilia- and flagella-associated protein 61 isoform X1 [Denticeps clupeoides]
MITVTSSSGKVEIVTARSTEAADAQEISNLLGTETTAVFGRVNVLYLLEKANLAVTLITARNKVLAHAAFCDYPIGELVAWEPFMQSFSYFEKCTPLNTLFLHLFVAQPNFSTGSAKEIVRTVFNAIMELQYICLVTSNSANLEPALSEIFEPVRCVKEPEVLCSAFVCHRHRYYPQLHIRKARVEDHDDLIHIFAEQLEDLSSSYGPYFLAELIESQDEENHVAVCENEGRAVGFMALSGTVNVKLLDEYFELGPFNGLTKANTEHPSDTADNAEKPLPSRQDGGGVLKESDDESDGQAKDSEQSQMISEPKTDSDIPNAFCIQMFIIDKRFEMRSVDFLPYVFKLFPERDFCTITVPMLSPEFALLQTFLRVISHHISTSPQELYIFHRAGLLKSFFVRVPLSADMPAIQALVNNLSLQEALLKDLEQFFEARRDPDGTPIQAFVSEVEGQIVGVIIIRNSEDIEFIRANYNIESYIYYSHHAREEHGQLCHFVLNPIFQHYAKQFLKEVLRQSQKSCLYYPIYPTNRCHKNSLASLLNYMVPVRPRRQILYPLEELGVDAPSVHITKDQVPYALSHINRKLTMEPKITINARIVVVGASDTALSFLETLVFCPHLRFNNITLISAHGYLGYYDNEKMRFLSTSHCYSDKEHGQLSLHAWVNVVEEKMTGIDRPAKHVVLSGGRIVPYHHLILCTGQQYQIPLPTDVDISKHPSGSSMPAQPKRRYAGPIPSNLFTLNGRHDCQAAYNWLLSNFIGREGDAVVYGSSIDAYTCVETLLHLGVSGSRLHLVHPPTNNSGSCFGDPRVEKAVMEALKKNEVHVYQNCALAQWNDGRHSESISSACFTTAEQPLRLKCAVFMNFSHKAVDYDTFKAINDACLVYDGRLVIDSAFHTNDPTIRAAGPLTKFSRRYHADHISHTNFNSREVGRELALELLPLFDPTLEPPASQPADMDRLIPIYSQAKIQGGRLPGGYSYLHATKPTQLAPSSDAAGREIVTGDAATGNYFCLRLSPRSTVETITCLSLRPLATSNYLCLYGKHEQLLNHLCSRYDEGLVPDLYSYFQESWCMALYHDRFADFEQEARQLMQSAQVQVGGDSVSMAELIRTLADGRRDVGGETGRFLRDRFEESGGLDAFKRSALAYLKYNRYHLTMYAQPGFL